MKKLYIAITFTFFVSQLYSQLQQVNVMNGPCGAYQISINNQDLDLGERDGNECLHMASSSIDIGSENSLVITDLEDPSYLNGISTLDLVLIMQGILMGFESDFQAYVSDWNQNGAVSTIDLLLMRRIILGIDVDSDVQQYYVYPEGFVFPEINSFDIPSLDFTNFDFSDSDLDGNGLNVVVFKIGDVNQNAAFDNEEDDINSRSGKDLKYQNLILEKGKTYKIPMHLSDDQGIHGFMANLQFEGIKVLDLESSYDNDQLMVNNTSNNLSISFLDLDSHNDIQFYIDIEAQENGYLEDFIALNDTKQNDVVSSGLEEYTLHLRGQDSDLNETGQASVLNICATPVDMESEIRLDLSVEGFVEIASYQFAVAWNKSEYKLIDIDNYNSDLHGLSDNFFSPVFENVPEDVDLIRTLWFNPTGAATSLEDGSVLFSIYLKKLIPSPSNNFGIVDDREFEVEIVNNNLDILEYNLNGVGCELFSFISSSTKDIDSPGLQLSIYPNPVSEILQVQWETLIDGIAEVYRLDGSKTHTININNKTSIMVPIQDLSNGTYLLKVTNQDGAQSVRKFMVAK